MFLQERKQRQPEPSAAAAAVLDVLQQQHEQPGQQSADSQRHSQEAAEGAAKLGHLNSQETTRSSHGGEERRSKFQWESYANARPNLLKYVSKFKTHFLNLRKCCMTNLASSDEVLHY